MLTERFGPENFRTADGHEITDGLIVWDHDLRLSRVDFPRTFRGFILDHPESWDGWFRMRGMDGSPASIMNGERMLIRHPFTGQRADERASEEIPTRTWEVTHTVTSILKANTAEEAELDARRALEQGDGSYLLRVGEDSTVEPGH